jgi:hypothetical protein
MFHFTTPKNEIVDVERAIEENKKKIKKTNEDKSLFRSSPKIYIHNSSGSKNEPYISSNTAFSLNAIDELLEKERNNNKMDSWNKLDKTVKMQKLHAFAERYVKENRLAIKEAKVLKTFFNDCLERNKLSKTKDLLYDKDSGEIVSIPSLFFQSNTHHFTLKNTDPKRVSTLKSLNTKALHRIKQEKIQGSDGDAEHPDDDQSDPI